MLTVMLWASCGGGASTASSGPTGTPAGNYAIIVDGISGSLTHSTTLTLVVK